MRLLSAFLSLFVLAFLNNGVTADLVNNCDGSNSIQNWANCDIVIQMIDDNEVYDAPRKWEHKDCLVEYRCYGKMIGKNTGFGGADWLHKHHYILGFSLRETVSIIKTMCLNRVYGNRIEGTYNTGNEDNCALTLNFKFVANP